MSAFLRPVTLPDQLWVDWHGSEWTPGPPIAAAATDHLGRPVGGMWTSSLVDGTSAYVEAMRSALQGVVPIVERAAWLLSPEPCEMLVVEDRLGAADLAALAPGPLVWEDLAGEVDAVHMTAQGALAFARMPPRDGRYNVRLRVLHAMNQAGLATPLDWWEAESTFWMHWRFSSVRKLGIVQVPSMPSAPQPGAVA